jgi:glycosyltransferase involved in cell wall biosynthesis
MRIAIDTQSVLGSKTGIGIYTSALLAALRETAPQHEFVELNLRREVRMRLDRRLRWQQWSLPRAAYRARSDLLHIPGFDAPAWKKCPVVLTVHDLIGRLFPQNLPPVSRFYWSRWLPFSIRFADYIIADSEHTQQDIVRLLKIDPARITVIPLAAGPQYQPIAQADTLQAIGRKYHLPERFILFVSTLEPRKGIDTLLAAYAALVQLLPDVPVVITGKHGWYTDQIFVQVKQLGLETRVIFTGYVPDEDLPALYNCAAVLAFPSRYEGFGLTVLEAMACGTPAVCSNASSLPEVAGDAALLVPPDRPDALADALRQVLADVELHRQMRERGLQQAARFSWEQTARRTLAVYEKVASASSG